MPLISIIIVLVVIGVILYLINTLLTPYIDANILKIINVFVVVIVILWLLGVVMGYSGLSEIRVGPILSK